jgi:tetratricopeptide (TPR) repeat protein
MQERVNQNPLLGETYARLAECEVLRERFDAAREHYLRAIHIHERVGDRRSEAASRVGLADVYMRCNKRAAREQYANAARLYAEVGDRSVAGILENKAATIVS